MHRRLLRFFSKAPAGPTIARAFASRRAAANNNNLSIDHTTAELDEKDLTAAREWLTKFISKTVTIPRDICEISFSRSGGPGGQNVNKSVPLPCSFTCTKIIDQASFDWPRPRQRTQDVRLSRLTSHRISPIG